MDRGDRKTTGLGGPEAEGKRRKTKTEASHSKKKPAKQNCKTEEEI